MSLANLITMSRGLAIVPIVFLLATGNRWAAWWLFGFACLTDLIDGWVARSRNEVTRLGKALDPIVDKALYGSILLTLYAVGDIPTLALTLFLIPQFVLVVGALVLRIRSNAVQGARVPGKAAAMLTFLAIGFLIVHWPGGTGILYAGIALTYVASVDYTQSAVKVMRNSRD